MARMFLLALTVFVVGASAAQANPRPLAGLERFYSHPTSALRVYGIGDNMSVYSKHSVAKTLPIYGIGDNMSFYGNNVVKVKVAKKASTTTAVRPDDRAGIRGAGFSQATFLNDKSDVMSRALNIWLASHPTRPNDRAGALGIGAPEATLGHWERRLALN